MVNNEAILKAIEELNSQKTPNVNITVGKYSIFHFTLQDYFKNKTISHNEAYFKSIMFFTIIQKLVLIEHINKFSVYNLHLTLQMLEILVWKL